MLCPLRLALRWESLQALLPHWDPLLLTLQKITYKTNQKINLINPTIGIKGNIAIQNTDKITNQSFIVCSFAFFAEALPPIS
jgi:hypothetical protein